MSVKHRIRPVEAAALRVAVRDDSFSEDARTAARDGLASTGRIWEPIELVAEMTSARASCRLCGEAIGKGEPAIRFGFDLYGGEGWGRLAAAYLHPTCPGETGS